MGCLTAQVFHSLRNVKTEGTNCTCQTVPEMNALCCLQACCFLMYAEIHTHTHHTHSLSHRNKNKHNTTPAHHTRQHTSTHSLPSAPHSDTHTDTHTHTHTHTLTS